MADAEGGLTDEKGHVYYVNTTKCNRRCCFILLIILILLGIAVAIYLLVEHVKWDSELAVAITTVSPDEEEAITEAVIPEIVKTTKLPTTT